MTVVKLRAQKRTSFRRLVLLCKTLQHNPRVLLAVESDHLVGGLLGFVVGFEEPPIHTIHLRYIWPHLMMR